MSDHCPWEDITPFTFAISEMYAAYEKGLWYVGGGWLDQPIWYTEAMNYYDAAVNAEIKKREDEIRQRNG